MSFFKVKVPFPVIPDIDGNPLEDGYVYIGNSGLNPETTPVAVYWDEALTIPAAQPIRTIGGYLSQNGAVGKIFISQNSYSITVRNKNGTLVWTDLNANSEGAESSITQIDSVIGFENLIGSTDINQLQLGAWVAGSNTGGGGFKWDATLARSNHNGGTIFSPTVVYTGATVADILNGVGETDPAALGVWVRIDPRVSILHFGATADGSTDDTAPLQALDAFGGGVIEGGTIRVQSSITLTGDYSFMSGGIIAPDSAYRITWGGAIVAGDYKIFDGDFLVSKVHKVDEVRITWFGAVSADVDTDSGDTALANSNARAIREAISMCSLGVPIGIYLTPTLKIPTGVFIVDDDDNDGVIIDCPSYATIKGEGYSSVIRVVDGAKEFAIISVTEDGANNFIIDDLMLDGEYSQQSAIQHGISVNPATIPCIYSRIGTGIYIKEMNGYGIFVTGSGMDNCTIAWASRIQCIR